MKTAEYIRRKAFDNENGAAMLAVMVTLVALTVIGIAATRTSNFESSNSGSQKRKQAAFYAAEAGLEHGKAVLNSMLEANGGSFNNWTFVLDGSSSLPGGGGSLAAADSGDWNNRKYWKGGVSLLSDVSFFDGKYKYTVKVWNNREDASATNDTDNTIVMRSQAEGKNGIDFAAVEVSIGAGLGAGSSRITEDLTAVDGGGAGKNYNAYDKDAVDVEADDGSTNFQL